MIWHCGNVACEKSSRRFDFEKIDRFLCISGPRVDARSWFRWIKFRFVDRKKIQIIGTDLILTLLTLCDMALWKCGLWEKFHKIRFGKDRWSVYAVPNRGWMLVVDSVRKIFRFVDRKKIQTIGSDLILKLLTLCDIALWKCSGLLIGKKSRKKSIGTDLIFTLHDTMWYGIVEMWLVRKVPEDSIWKR